MQDIDIKTLIKLLILKNRLDLADLLIGSKNDIYGWGQFGSKFNAEKSTFIIFSPAEKYFKLKDLPRKDNDLIFELVHHVYPDTEGEPEISKLEFRILKEGQEEKLTTPIYIGRTTRVFVSYSTMDKIFAGRIKAGLEVYGFEVFLAHEDIDPATEWQDVILANLASTDIFLPIITEEFIKSKWTDQESGIAFINNKLIIPISVDGNHPYGFLGKFQSLKLNPNDPILDADAIVRAIIKVRPNFENQIIDSVIKSFVASSSWDDAKFKSKLLCKFENFTDKQLNEIFRGSVTNHEIYASFGAQSTIKILYRKFKERLDPKLKTEVATIYEIIDQS